MTYGMPGILLDEFAINIRLFRNIKSFIFCVMGILRYIGNNNVIIQRFYQNNYQYFVLTIQHY